MLDHFGFCVPKFEDSVIFYEACLAPLGLNIIERHPYGAVIVARSAEADVPFIWIGQGPSFANDRRDPKLSPVHFCFTAPDRDAVDRFHAAGLDAGGKDNGPPGDREPGYYAAYVLDPNGYNIEAAFRDPAVR